MNPLIHWGQWDLNPSVKWDQYISKFWICNDCFNEKMYNNKLFKDDLIQVVEL